MSLHSLLSASLATTPHQSPIKFSTTWSNCPEPDEVFNVLTTGGVVVRVECTDEYGHEFAGKDRDYVSADLVGWWRDPPEPPYQLSERQQIAADKIEEHAWASALGREEDE